MSPRIRAAAVTAALLLALAGCGSDSSGGTASDPAGESPSVSTTPTPSESVASPTPSDSASAGADATDEPVVLPACTEVWVEGATVPKSYEGCLDGSETVPADGRYCEFGKPLLTFQDTYYAVAGGPVQATSGPLLKNARYRDALKKCGG